MSDYTDTIARNWFEQMNGGHPELKEKGYRFWTNTDADSSDEAALQDVASRYAKHGEVLIRFPARYPGPDGSTRENERMVGVFVRPRE